MRCGYRFLRLRIPRLASALWMLAALLAAASALAQQVQPRYVQEREELANWYYARLLAPAYTPPGTAPLRCCNCR